MSFTEQKRKEIRKYLLRKIDSDDEKLIPKVADAFGISLTSVKRYLEVELSEDHIVPDAEKKCGYSLVFQRESFRYETKGLDEYCDLLLAKDVLPIISAGENARKLWSYMLSEMFNNVLEHSRGTVADCRVENCCLYGRVFLTDNGKGVFRTVCDTLEKNGFRSPTVEDAVMELYKGKLTSAPQHHSGEGIFFTMKMADRFFLWSSDTLMKYGYSETAETVRSRFLAYASGLTGKGTTVMMKLDHDTMKSTKEIFNRYSDPDNGFYKTLIPVRDVCEEFGPVSRSQARSICFRLENFKEAVLDFTGVEFMGQGFADELFRVFQNKYPDLMITPINMSDAVNRMYLTTIHNVVS